MRGGACWACRPPSCEAQEVGGTPMCQVVALRRLFTGCFASGRSLSMRQACRSLASRGS